MREREKALRSPSFLVFWLVGGLAWLLGLWCLVVGF